MKKNTHYTVLLCLSLIGLFAGCGISSNSDDTSNVPAATFKELTETYTIENGATMQQLDMLVMQGASSIEEVEPFITAEDPQTRWLAVYVIGRVSDHDSVTPLLPLLEDDNEVVRISAAGTLANKGYKEALPVLISGLESTAVIEYLHPQKEIASFCQEVLTAYTFQAFTTKADWDKWWNEAGQMVQWNAEEKLYR